MNSPGAVVSVVDAVRTPVGARNGQLAGWHAADLAAEVLDALVRRTGVAPAVIDEVVVGCASPVGDQGCNVARNAVLAAGWPESVPATTVDAQGASSLRAVAVAADAIRAGSAEVVVAAGVEVSSTTPAGAWVTPTCRPFGPAVTARYAGAGGLVPPGVAAETLVERRGLHRHELDAWTDESRCRARLAAGRAHAGSDGVVTIEGRAWDRERRQVLPGERAMSADELVVAADPGDPSACRPMFVPGGRITAANSAAAADGAAAVLLVAEGRASSMGLDTLARVVASASGAVDPLTMLTGAVPASERALARAGLGVADVDRFEVDESFAAVTLDWMASLGVGAERVNVDGGALARGLAGGAAGAAMVVALVHGLAGTARRWGLAALGGVGGTGSAVVVEVGGPDPGRGGRP